MKNLKVYPLRRKSQISDDFGNIIFQKKEHALSFMKEHGIHDPIESSDVITLLIEDVGIVDVQLECLYEHPGDIFYVYFIE